MNGRRGLAIGACLTVMVGFGIAETSGTSAATVGPRAAGSTGRVWISVSGGGGSTCGIRRDHTLWCWGWNGKGQLGVGDLTDRDVPTQVGAEADWATVEAGDEDTCATRTDHTLWCWGWNRFGQLGVGGKANRDLPTQVGTDTDWATVNASYDHTCGTRATAACGAGDTTLRRARCR